LRIFSSTGEIIFSSQADEIGTVNNKSYFHEVVAKGKIFSKIAVKESLSAEGGAFQQDVVETYVPIVRNGSFLGAIEVYQDMTETSGAIHRIFILTAALPIAVMLLFSIGFCVGVVKVDRFIQLQRETELKLKEQHNALELEKREQSVIFNKVEQAKKEWENTMDCVADMVMLTNTEYKIQRCNKAVLDFTGLSYREVFKKRVFDIFPEHENFQEECFERGCEYYHQPTDQWFLLTVYSVKNSAGEVIALVFNVHDLTEIKKVSIALQNSNIEIDDNRRQLQEALNSISELLSKVVNEKTFDVTFENPTLQRCYIVKKCGQEDCPCYGREPVRCWQEQGTFCVGGKAGSAVDKRECLHCNHYRSTIADPIFQLGEQFNNMMYILAEKNKEVEQAYSDMKMAQSQLLQQEKMASIGQLAAGVAHEINNPMGFIGSNITTLAKYVGKLEEFFSEQAGVLEKFVTDTEALAKVAESRKRLKLDFVLEDMKDLISESLDGCDRVKKIVMDLKGFSRVDQAEYQKIDINECIDSTLNIVWNELKYKVKLKKEYGQLDLLSCYPQQLNQVFMNLLVNAAQAIEKEGLITIKTWQDEAFVYASITDNGSGMPTAVRDKVFEPFFTTKDVGKGTGLGLSIVYEIITKNHHGEIHVESAEGEGTCFTIKIPILIQGPL
jgi:PAS domain S-box-containing protein